MAGRTGRRTQIRTAEACAGDLVIRGVAIDDQIAQAVGGLALSGERCVLQIHGPDCPCSTADTPEGAVDAECACVPVVLRIGALA